MPGRNIYKDYLAESYYHIYNRGVNKGLIFRDKQDFVMFLDLLKRYLGTLTEQNRNQVDLPNYKDQVELLAYCLMGNHFHLFIYQLEDEQAITKFMRSLSTAYSMYFNKKYKRVGPLFQQRYRAVRITDNEQLLHITRYIHLNPANYRNYEWSSYSAYTGNYDADWIKPDRVLQLFEGVDYSLFVDDYRDKHDELELFKNQLADG